MGGARAVMGVPTILVSAWLGIMAIFFAGVFQYYGNPVLGFLCAISGLSVWSFMIWSFLKLIKSETLISNQEIAAQTEKIEGASL